MKELILSELCQDGQDYKMLEKIYDRILKFLSAGEKISYIAIQKKPALNLFPDSIVLTQRRIYLCEFTNLGRNLKPTILEWEQVMDISYQEYSGMCTLTIVPNLDVDFIIEHIPLEQGYKIMMLSDEMRNAGLPTAMETPPTPAQPLPSIEKIETQEPENTFEFIENETKEQEVELEEELEQESEITREWNWDISPSDEESLEVEEESLEDEENRPEILEKMYNHFLNQRISFSEYKKFEEKYIK